MNEQGRQLDIRDVVARQRQSLELQQQMTVQAGATAASS
jgi:hypothetical protein